MYFKAKSASFFRLHNAFEFNRHILLQFIQVKLRLVVNVDTLNISVCSFCHDKSKAAEFAYFIDGASEGDFFTDMLIKIDDFWCSFLYSCNIH